MDNYSGKLQQLLCLLICVLMVVAVSIRRGGRTLCESATDSSTKD